MKSIGLKNDYFKSPPLHLHELNLHALPETHGIKLKQSARCQDLFCSGFRCCFRVASTECLRLCSGSDTLSGRQPAGVSAAAEELTSRTRHTHVPGSRFMHLPCE